MNTKQLPSVRAAKGHKWLPVIKNQPKWTLGWYDNHNEVFDLGDED